jgi:hypothetical protein
MQAAQINASDPSMSSVELVTDDYAVGIWRNVLVVDWKVRTTGDAARDVNFRLQRLAKSHTRGVFYFAYVAESALPPEFEARQVLARMLRSGSEYTLGGAVVFDGAGLRGAFVRGVATGLVLLARPSFPFVVCSLPEASRMFAGMATARGLAFASDRFLVEVPALRATMSAHPDSGTRGVR